MKRSLHGIVLLAALLVCAPVAACGSGEPSGGGTRVAETAASEPGAPTIPEGAERAAALDGIGEADRAATRWNDDAELYAIASVTPRVDAGGNAPGWLYTYVSPSAGTVASVSVAGGDAELTPEQELPDDQIEDVSNNTLPPPDELLDSPEAMQKAGEVRDVLRSEPEAEVSAGLDSFSGREPVWIFSTARGGERVEERIPAVEGGS